MNLADYGEFVDRVTADPEENVRKLSQRYPEGVFSVEKSENRAEGDV